VESLTRRRGEIKGREAVAWWRIRSAVWGARLFAALFAVVSAFPIVYSGFPDRGSASKLFALALLVLGLAEWMRRGAKRRACRRRELARDQPPFAGL
jgi:hypothetical protein